MMKKQKNTLNAISSIWTSLRFLFAIGFFLLASPSAKASHFSGADITYQCMGPNQYLITLTVYRDCSGIGLSTVSEFLEYSSASCGLAGSISAPMVGSIVEVSPLCPSALSQSSCGTSGNLYPGMQAGTYEVVITFPQACTDWVVSWSSCCRNGAVTNLQNPAGAGTFVAAMINTTICNSSPVFINSPTPYFCAGNCYQYSYGTVDPDGDSLVYALSCPLSNATNCVANTAGQSPTQPLVTNPFNSLQFNQNTGQMSFCLPAGLAQSAVVAVTVFQIVNGDTVGYIQRDIQMTVINSANCTTPVDISPLTLYTGGTYNAGNNAISACVGSNLTFAFTAYDADGDTITINSMTTNLNAVLGAGNWNALIYNDPITVFPYRPDSALVLINFVPTANHIGNNYITIGLTDNACPIIGEQSLDVNIIVVGIHATVPTTVLCPGVAQQLQLNTTTFSGGNPETYAWMQTAGPSISFSDDTIANPMIAIPASMQDGDSIVLSVSYTTSGALVCNSNDEIKIYFQAMPISLDALASEINLCPNGLIDTIALTTTIISPNIPNGNYVWSSTPASYTSNLSNVNINNPMAMLSGNAGDSLMYIVSYTYGLCAGMDTVKMWFDAATLYTEGDTSICAGDTIQLSAFYSSLNAASSGVCGANTTSICNGPENQYVVGTATITTVYPYRNFWEDARTQMLYRASELLSAGVTAGLIKEAALSIITKGSVQPFSSFTIKIGCTADSQFGAGQAFVPNLTEVYSNTITTAVGWNNYTFHTPYQWDGVSNLIVEICFDNNAWTDDDDVEGEITSYASVLEFEADGVSGCTAASERFTSNRPVIRFTNCPLASPGNYSWTPPFGFVSNSDTLGIATVVPQASLTYYVEATNGDCHLWDSVVVTINSTIAAPTITSGTTSNPATSVLFEWGQSPGSTAWEYSLDSGVTWVSAFIQDSSLLVTGLVTGACANILVRPVGGTGPCLTNAAAYFAACSLDSTVTQNGLVLRAAAAGPQITYQWIDCNNGGAIISGETGQEFTPTVNGNYAVIISDGTNTVTSPCTQVTVVGIDQVAKDLGLVLYPNPTSGLLYIDKKDNAEIYIKVLDNMGRLLLSTTSSDLKTTLDLNQYPSGMYLVVLQNDTNISTQKIVKR